MKFCNQCGNNLDKKALYCSKCDYKISKSNNNSNTEINSIKKRKSSIYATTSLILVIISVLSFISGILILNHGLSIKTVGFPQQIDYIVYIMIGMLILILFLGTMIASLLFSIFSYQLKNNNLSKYIIIINLLIIIFIVCTLILEEIFKIKILDLKI